MSFDFNVSYSSCWGYSLKNTLKLIKKDHKVPQSLWKVPFVLEAPRGCIWAVIFPFGELVRSVSNTRIFIDLHLPRLTHLHDARRLTHVRGVSVWTCPRGAILKSSAISREEFSLSFLCWQRIPQIYVRAIPSYQRRPSYPRKREGNVRFPTNLHGVRRSARPTSTWAPKAHHVMGKTQ